MQGLIPYDTVELHPAISGMQLTLTAVRDLDRAIDQLCELIESRGGSEDPLAPDLCPYFGLLWPAGLGLADYVARLGAEIRGKHVLEIGCGLALPSLVAAKLGARVVATDFHPDVEMFLKRNSQANHVSIDYVRYNWRSEQPLGDFDWVIGSDILYEGKHPKEVARSLAAHVRPDGRIILTDPGRSYLQQFSSGMQELGFQEKLLPVHAEGKDIYLLDFLPS